MNRDSTDADNTGELTPRIEFEVDLQPRMYGLGRVGVGVGVDVGSFRLSLAAEAKGVWVTYD